jgi:hypothetical protein
MHTYVAMHMITRSLSVDQTSAKIVVLLSFFSTVVVCSILSEQETTALNSAKIAILNFRRLQLSREDIGVEADRVRSNFNQNPFLGKRTQSQLLNQLNSLVMEKYLESDQEFFANFFRRLAEEEDDEDSMEAPRYLSCPSIQPVESTSPKNPSHTRDSPQLSAPFTASRILAEDETDSYCSCGQDYFIEMVINNFDYDLIRVSLSRLSCNFSAIFGYIASLYGMTAIIVANLLLE